MVISENFRLECLEAGTSQIVYLASPYTSGTASQRKRRFEMCNTAAAKLIEAGYIVFSPITMTHPIDLLLAKKEQTLGSDYWVKFDEAFMKMCSAIVILCIDGWRESKGVKREIEYFRKNGKKVEYLEPESVGIFSQQE